VDKVAAWVRWRKVGNDWELWFVSDGNGFQIIRFTDSFMAHNKSLFGAQAGDQLTASRAGNGRSCAARPRFTRHPGEHTDHGA